MVIFLDNNATTIMPAEARTAMSQWCNRGNPSSSYATSAQKLLGMFKDEIVKLVGADYDIIITSGASESNCTAIRGVVDHYWITRRTIPHIIVSTIEHKSILLTVEQLMQLSRAEVSYIKPTTTGFINPASIQMRSNTAAVIIMHANNETGAVNDAAAIQRICSTHAGRPVYICDAVQSIRWGYKCSADIITMSLHKMKGPSGVGVICKRKSIQMLCTICGVQNNGLRGGTENIPGIAGALVGLQACMVDRVAKNLRLTELRKRLVAGLKDRVPVLTYAEYLAAIKHKTVECVLLTGDTDYVPNTLLLSIVRRTPPAVCNTNIKRILELRGILVSIGSACNTKSDKASHVLYEMGADEFVRRGTLRISAGDESTAADIDRLVRELVLIIAEINKY